MVAVSWQLPWRQHQQHRQQQRQQRPRQRQWRLPLMRCRVEMAQQQFPLLLLQAHTLWSLILCFFVLYRSIPGAVYGS